MPTDPAPEMVAALRQLAEKATPGPWIAKVRGEEGEVFTDGPGGTLVAIGRRHDAKPDAAYIAAANPAAILALLDDVARLEHRAVCRRAGTPIDRDPGCETRCVAGSGRAAMHRAIADPRTPMSLELAQKLDALSGEEWDELTEWLTSRTNLATERLGVHLVTQQSLADALTKVIGGEEIFEDNTNDWTRWAGLILEEVAP